MAGFKETDQITHAKGSKRIVSTKKKWELIITHSLQ